MGGKQWPVMRWAGLDHTQIMKLLDSVDCSLSCLFTALVCCGEARGVCLDTFTRFWDKGCLQVGWN
jgi:hypothetical protein